MPTAQTRDTETMAGIRRTAAGNGKRPNRKLVTTADILRKILAPIGGDLVGLRDRDLRLTLPRAKCGGVA